VFSQPSYISSFIENKNLNPVRYNEIPIKVTDCELLVASSLSPPFALFRGDIVFSSRPSPKFVCAIPPSV
jgi:hypothetical protein